MELILNLAWALCSLALICFWIRVRLTAPSGGLRTPFASPVLQALALTMVVLLLLPAISLSDDQVAAQGLTESDCCVRRASLCDHVHPSLIPVALDLPRQEFAGLAQSSSSQVAVQDFYPLVPASLLSCSLDSRPPPQA